MLIVAVFLRDGSNFELKLQFNFRVNLLLINTSTIQLIKLFYIETRNRRVSINYYN